MREGLLRCTPLPRWAAASRARAPPRPGHRQPRQPRCACCRCPAGGQPWDPRPRAASRPPPPASRGSPATTRSPTGFQFRDEPPPLPPLVRNSGSEKPLSPPAARLPGRAGPSAPPAGGQPFPTSDCGTCRSAGAGNGRTGARSRAAFETFRTAPKGRQGSAPVRRGRARAGSRGPAGDCGKRGGEGSRRRERPCGARPAARALPVPLALSESPVWGRRETASEVRVGPHFRASAADRRHVKFSVKINPSP